ncbi:importin-alpha export receptor [Coelomomyces lativittatus]|nr:importin-alpha export receptor [Coelomomyces lativittatus]KAJ1512224.1 importin-alpha export receptor [Coelomomyces lativittatus]
MEFNHPFWNSEDPTCEEPSTLDLLKCAICEITSLFLDKYTEDWVYTEAFVQATSMVLNTITPQPKQDLLVSRAMTLLSKIVRSPSLVTSFQSPDVLNSLVQRVVLPNMTLRPSDEEAFEDDPIQFVLRNIEGAEVDTRAHAASELVKSLMEFFESPMMAICEKHLVESLNAYYAHPTTEYKKKDLAITLYIAASSKHRLQKDTTGFFSGTSAFNILHFCQTHIITDLQPQAQVHPILIMDALKFLNVFRFQIDASHSVNLLKMVASHLTLSPHGIHLWAAMVCERYLSLLPPTEAAPAAVSVARLMIPSLMKETVPTKLQENDVLLKTIWRSMKLGYLDVEEIMKLSVHCFTLVSTHPSSPKFIHYLFECMALLIREVQVHQPHQVTQLESFFFPPFFSFFEQQPLEAQTDFLPFLLQLFAQLLEAHPSSNLGLPPLYQPLVPLIFNPLVWDQASNLAGLVILLKTFLRKDPTYFSQPSMLSTLLGATQLLLKSKMNFHYGFDLLKFIVVYVDPQAFQPMLKSLLNFLFVRLNAPPKSERFEQAFVSFFSYYVCTLPHVDPLIQMIESIQPGLTLTLLQQIVQKHFLSISGKEARRTLILGCTRLVCDSSMLPHSNPDFLQVYLTHLKKCVEQTRADMDGTTPFTSFSFQLMGDPDDDELQAQSTKLISIPVIQYLPLADEQQPSVYFSTSLKKLSEKHPSLRSMVNPLLESFNLST